MTRQVLRKQWRRRCDPLEYLQFNLGIRVHPIKRSIIGITICLLAVIGIACCSFLHALDDFTPIVFLGKVNRPSGAGAAVFYSEESMEDRTLSLFIEDPSAVNPIMFIGIIESRDEYTRLKSVFWSSDGSLLVIVTEHLGHEGSTTRVDTKAYDFKTHRRMNGNLEGTLAKRGGRGGDVHWNYGMPPRRAGRNEFSRYRRDLLSN